MAWYCVAVICAGCGQQHGVVMGRGFQVPGGPARAGTAVELWPSGEWPPGVASLPHDLVWCPRAAAYLEQPDPAKWLLEPKG